MCIMTAEKFLYLERAESSERCSGTRMFANPSSVVIGVTSKARECRGKGKKVLMLHVNEEKSDSAGQLI